MKVAAAIGRDAITAGRTSQPQPIGDSTAPLPSANRSAVSSPAALGARRPRSRRHRAAGCARRRRQNRCRPHPRPFACSSAASAASSRSCAWSPKDSSAMRPREGEGDRPDHGRSRSREGNRSREPSARRPHSRLAGSPARPRSFQRPPVQGLRWGVCGSRRSPRSCISQRSA